MKLKHDGGQQLRAPEQPSEMTEEVTQKAEPPTRQLLRANQSGLF